ncbi:trypsin-like peptidase domain-containing protein [Deinococcus sp. 6YEL10]|uniref:S1C family serine protease n=1 Tax=Deinococcus sp. 6YEL10 TaxID=2745870 RepID=UPI001E4035D1|nr:trypsin-like peptidase domain-containing protein [Deinococcus sp. 6YEL10]MCD0162637.1 trypsin-like peptidase domain-containing protein [Deinococcus sp. 6YEL10]
MKRSLSILALTGTLAVGGLVGYELNTRTAPVTASATTSAATQTAPDTNLNAGSGAQGQMVPAASSTYDGGRARTESEANTVQVVKDRQDGLVFVSVKESSEDSAQAQLRQRLQQQFPFALPDGGSGQEQTGTGSGFFVTDSGDIITNNHVVEGASEITVRLHGDDTEYTAKVVARAPDFDLALIRAEGLPSGAARPIPLGDSDQLDVGLKAVAMGAPFGLDFSVSEGIISSLERTVPVGTRGVQQNVIQTDAAINPGNSGGPLLDSAGQVIGVNTQILTGGSGQSAGVGFAIPVNTVKKLLPQLQAGNGGVIQTPTLGVQFTDLSVLSEQQRKQAGLPAQGALIQEVAPDSPAAAAGLQGGTTAGLELNTPQAATQGGADTLSTDGDIITAVDGQPIGEGDDLRRAIIGKRIGDRVKLTVQRAGKTRTVDVTLSAFSFPSNSQ